MTLLASLCLRSEFIDRIDEYAGNSEITSDQIVPYEEDKVKSFSWVKEADADDFEKALQESGDVEEYCVESDNDDELYYTVVHSDRHHREIYDYCIENGVAFRRFEQNTDRQIIDVRVADRESLKGYISLVDSYDQLRITLRWVDDLSSDGNDSHKAQLTDKQSEVVKYALTNGYYDQPREIGMSDIANEFSVSTQAISDRLRRANKKLAKEFVN